PVVPAARVRTVQRRRHRHAYPAPRAPREGLGSAPRALLPAHRAHGARPPQRRAHRIRGDVRLCGLCPARPRAAAGAAARGFRRRRHPPRRGCAVGRCAVVAARDARMNSRRLLAVLHDVLAAAAAWILAFWLRFNLDIPPEFGRAMLASLPWAVGLYSAAFLAFGLYRGLWRFASLPDLRRIVLAVGTGALAVPALFALMQGGFVVPRSVYLLTPVLLAALMAGSRIAYRAW